MTRIGIGWHPSTVHGWGVFGLNLTLELARRADTRPVLLDGTRQVSTDPLRAALLRSVITHSRAVLEEAGSAPLPFPGFFTLDYHFRQVVTDRAATPSIGFTFFEDTRFRPGMAEAGRRMRHVVAGSIWNGAVLQGHGVTNTVVAPQGVDTSLFHPAPRRGLFRDRFAIFSGGKLEFRKGQDIVLAAFHAFHQRHPEAVLVTAWANPWPDNARGIAASPHVRGAPAVQDDRLDIGGWLRDHGLPADSFLVLDAVPNPVLPQVIRECDVGLFPNRCEGGTNLVAMEVMACGVPVILSDNTGHRDLLATGGARALQRQGPVNLGPVGTAGWGESTVEEAVETLEALWRDRTAAGSLGAAGAEAMRDWDWRPRVDHLLRVTGIVGS